MKDETSFNILLGFFAFTLTMAVIGWAKFVDQKKDSELWYARYSDEVDELRRVREQLGDVDFMRHACIVDRNLYKEALDDIPAYCSEGLYEVTIDGLRKELALCEQDFRSLTDDRNYTLTYCGWDMCLCNDGFEGCPIYVLEYYADQAVCKSDRNCKNCMWQMIDNGGGLEHDEILWCLEHAYHP